MPAQNTSQTALCSILSEGTTLENIKKHIGEKKSAYLKIKPEIQKPLAYQLLLVKHSRQKVNSLFQEYKIKRYVDQATTTDETALKLSVGKNEILTHLISLGADLHRTNSCKANILHYAINRWKHENAQEKKSSYFESISILIKAGADPQIKNINNETPLDFLTKKEQEKINTVITSVQPHNN